MERPAYAAARHGPADPAAPTERDPDATADPAEDPLQVALRYLNRRDRTVSEVWRHLARRGFETSSVEDVVRQLTEQRYLDDARYARLFAQDKRELEQWGSDRIRRSLLERGIDRRLVDDTLSASEADGELERAVALLRRRFSSAPRERRERDSALAVLLRKGYDPELALDALAAYSREQT